MLKDLLGGKMYMAPIGDNPQKIIDLGTGFGEWAIEGMSTRHPDTQTPRHPDIKTDPQQSARPSRAPR